MTQEVIIGSDLRGSKLYATNLQENYLKSFQPDLDKMLLAELLIDQEYPRKDNHGEDTRILVNYTNLKGNSMAFMIVDPDRLNNPFDVDEFVNKYFAALNEGEENSEELDKVFTPTLMMAMNESLLGLVGLSDNPMNEREKAMASQVVTSLTSVLLNDPLDAIVMMSDKPSESQEGEVNCTIDHIWAVKTRD